MSNLDKNPTGFWAVEYVSTHGLKWIFAETTNQGAARGRAEHLANFVRHSKQIPLSEEQYKQGKAALAAQAGPPVKMLSNQGRTYR